MSPEISRNRVFGNGTLNKLSFGIMLNPTGVPQDYLFGPTLSFIFINQNIWFSINIYVCDGKLCPYWREQ